MEIETPRLDAGKGLLLLGDGQGGFSSNGPTMTGFLAENDAKDMIQFTMGTTGKKVILVSNNNGPLEAYSHIQSSKVN